MSQIGGWEQLTLPHRDRPTLTVVSGTAVGTVIRLVEGEEVVVGRDPDVTLSIDDPGLSRRHFRAYVKDGVVWAEDLGSKNGTHVERQKLTGPRVLESEDRIQLGHGTVLKYTLLDRLEQEAAHMVYEWTIRDPLTNLHNRRYLDQRLEAELAFARRHATTLSLVLLDVDHFKSFNDDRGHLAGDVILSALGHFLGRAIRTEDVAARYGGEELAVLARAMPHMDALSLGERLRQSISGLVVPWMNEELQVTVSVGVTTWPRRGEEQGSMSVDELVGRADEALYRAKAAGRNCVCD